jgi:hypothetical protein
MLIQCRRVDKNLIKCEFDYELECAIAHGIMIFNDFAIQKDRQIENDDETSILCKEKNTVQDFLEKGVFTNYELSIYKKITKKQNHPISQIYLVKAYLKETFLK